MPKIEQLLKAYDDNHRSPVDRLLHWVCVPVSVWAIVALLWSIPFPWPIGRGIVPLNWAVIGVAAVQIHYIRLSRRLGSGLMLFNLALLWLTATVAVRAPLPLWKAGLAALAAAWAAYFLGTLAEGKRPSLSAYPQFVLIGPIWLASILYRKLSLPT